MNQSLESFCHSTITTKEEDEVLKHDADGDVRPLRSPTLALWDCPNDLENPLNWPTRKKWINGGLLGVLSLLQALAISTIAPGVPQLMQEFHNTNEMMATFVVSSTVIGLAFGPLVIAPLSELCGRVVVYHACNTGLLASLAACALAPSLGALITFRFTIGMFGSCATTNPSASMSDMFPQEKQARVIAVVMIGQVIAPILGPIAGGFISAAMGWRWVFWTLAGAQGVLTITMFVFMRETYHPLILQRRVRRLRKATGDNYLQSQLDRGTSPREHLKQALVRPLQMLFTAPIVLIIALYSGIIYGFLYLLFSSISEVFQETYHFPTNILGLSYTGLGVGTIIGMVINAKLSDAAVRRTITAQDSSEERAEPEVRLRMLPLGGIFLPIGLFIYGWTAEYHVHWIGPMIGTSVVGFGNVIAFMATNMYLIDAFLPNVASALAAVTLVRSIGGGVLPIFALKMYSTLGLGYGNSLLGLVAVLLVPVPFLLMRFGERLRRVSWGSNRGKRSSFASSPTPGVIN